ncbi:Aste57867_21942 [Aphanomyces stellatus]|uniref:Aste57867_21942 protein n=1 Tax=Aphanomyces stellatus TaxID=120398 RepID=A0A485LIV8_9STRA|nr:hypothetical protein As57867_021873 [Aphanomyces stellatus]VFT98610.1 Aste57867_21942 [Aphanomyces stellatus]
MDQTILLSSSAEMKRLLGMGMVSQDDLDRILQSSDRVPPLLRATTGASSSKLAKAPLRPMEMQLPAADVLSILAAHAHATKEAAFTNHIQDEIRDLIGAILDHEKYSTMDEIQRQIQTKLDVDMRGHLDWLQDTIFHLSKQKLRQINHAAEQIRRAAAATRVQRAFRVRGRWVLRRRARDRDLQHRLAADAVARQAIQGYARDVLARGVRRRVFLLRFRRLVLQRKREVVEQHALDIARRHMARWRLSTWLWTAWAAYKLARETRARHLVVQHAVATMVQAIGRGFLARRKTAAWQKAAAAFQQLYRRHRHNHARVAAVGRIQTCVRRWRAAVAQRQVAWRQESAAICMQAWARRRWRRRRLGQAAASVVKWCRAVLVRRREARAVAERQIMRLQQLRARQIQARVRQFVDGCRRRKHAAATRLQLHVKTFLARCLRRQTAAATIARHVHAWHDRLHARLRQLLNLCREKCMLRREVMTCRQRRARRILAMALISFVCYKRTRKEDAARCIQRCVRSKAAKKRAADERRRRSSGLVPIRPPARKPHSLPAVTKPEDMPDLPPVRLIKRYERLCKTCHAHGAQTKCHHVQASSSSSPVRKMVAVRTSFGARVTEATAVRAYELLAHSSGADGTRLQRLKLHSQPTSSSAAVVFVARPPPSLGGDGGSGVVSSSQMPMRPSLRKSMSLRMAHAGARVPPNNQLNE